MEDDLIKGIPTENKAAYSRIVLLIKKSVFTCIMAIYYKKDSVNSCKTSFTRVRVCKHWKNEKCRCLHLSYVICVSYFQSGWHTVKNMIP